MVLAVVEYVTIAKRFSGFDRICDINPLDFSVTVSSLEVIVAVFV